MAGRKSPPSLKEWYASPRRRRIACEALAKVNAQRHLIPKCGAKTKGTGLPCEAPALANGRCRVHGGLTPKGDQWHKPQFVNFRGKRAEKKLARKQADLEKRQAERTKRLAQMTPEERERHEAWQRTHKPGPRAERQRAQQQRKTRAWLAEVLKDDPPQTAITGDVFG